MLVHVNIQVSLVYVDKLALCMDMQGEMDLKKKLTDGCLHSSVHTAVFTDGDTWSYASDSILHVDVDKLALCMDMQGINALKIFTDECSQSSVHSSVHRW